MGQTMGEYLTVIFIITLCLAELSGKVVILCLHILELARQCWLIKSRAIDLVQWPSSVISAQQSEHSFFLASNIPFNGWSEISWRNRVNYITQKLTSWFIQSVWHGNKTYLQLISVLCIHLDFQTWFDGHDSTKRLPSGTVSFMNQTHNLKVTLMIAWMFLS